MIRLIKFQAIDDEEKVSTYRKSEKTNRSGIAEAGEIEELDDIPEGDSDTESEEDDYDVELKFD